MVRCIYAMVLMTALALGLVWQGAGMRRVGYDVERLHEQMADQQAQRAMLETHLSKLKSPQRVTTLVAYLGLDLQPPMPAAEPQEMAIARSTTPTSGAVGSIDNMAVAAATGF